MSDTPQGPAWWQATDGKWYPPQNQPPPPPPQNAPPPPPGQPPPGQPPASQPGATPAAGQPYQPKKGNQWKIALLACGGLFLLLIIGGAIAAIVGGGDDDEGNTVSAPTSTTTTLTGDAATGDAESETPEGAASTCKDTPPEESLDTERQGLYPGRPDTQDEDHEAEVGDCVRISGLTAYVNGAAIEPEFPDAPAGVVSDDQLVIDVTIENRDSSAKPYNLFEWSIQTPSGQVLDPTIYFGDDGLGSGSLVQGGAVTGKIAFDVPSGSYFVIWKPGMFEAARGIWQIAA